MKIEGDEIIISSTYPPTEQLSLRLLTRFVLHTLPLKESVESLWRTPLSGGCYWIIYSLLCILWILDGKKKSSLPPQSGICETWKTYQDTYEKVAVVFFLRNNRTHMKKPRRNITIGVTEVQNVKRTKNLKLPVKIGLLNQFRFRFLAF